MRTVGAVNAWKLLTGATAWLASVAMLSLSSVPAHAQGKKPKAVLAAAAEEPPPSAEPPAASAPADEAASVQGPRPDLPAAEAEVVEGPRPDVGEAAPEVQDVPLPSDVEPPAEIAAPTEPPNHTAAYVLWTAAAVSLGIGTTYGVLALKAKKDFDDDPTYKGADKSHDRGVAADVSLGVGVILAATGLAFYFAKDGGDTNDAAAHAPARLRADVSVAPYVGRSAGGGNLSVRF